MLNKFGTINKFIVVLLGAAIAVCRHYGWLDAEFVISTAGTAAAAWFVSNGQKPGGITAPADAPPIA